MAFCKNCGAQMDDNTKYCPTCGAPVGEAINPNPNPNPEPAPAPAPEQQNYQAQGNVNNANPTDDASDVANNKVFAILAYFGLLVLIPILAAPNSKFARFHANQGLLLFILEVICMFVGVIPIIGALVSLVGSVAILVFFVMGIINAAKGEMKELPLIGSIQLLK